MQALPTPLGTKGQPRAYTAKEILKMNLEM